MADYDQIMTALRNAHAAGDTAAAQRLAAMAKAAKSEPGQAMQDRIAAAKAGTLPMRPGSEMAAQAADEAALAQMQPAQGVMGQVGDIVAGTGAGALRGAAGLLDLPGDLAGAYGGLVGSALEKSGLVSPEIARLAGEAAGGSFPGRMAEDATATSAAKAIGSEYVAPGTVGEYAGTIGEFLPGALLGGLNMSNLLRYGVIPAIASETAGQVTEGTKAEPYARAAAAILASLAAGKPGSFAGDTEAAKLANRLEDAGVGGITAGQARASQPLMRMEGRLQATEQQLKDMTKATLRQLGSEADVATPEVLRGIEQNLVGAMDDAVRGVTIAPTSQHASDAMAVASNYLQRVPAGSLTPRIKGIAKEISAISASGKDVPLSRLKMWRSDIGTFTVSSDAATREAAHALRGLIDDMTDAALTAAGRSDDIAKLGAAREAYRNYIGVRDAASRAGAEAGVLSPQQLNQSMIRAQGREAYATGRSTPMTEFTRAGASVLRPAPAVSAGGTRTIAESLPLALASLGAGASYSAGLGPVGLGLGAAAGAMAPSIGQAVMRSAPVQAILRDPAGGLLRSTRGMTGLLAQ